MINRKLSLLSKQFLLPKEMSFTISSSNTGLLPPIKTTAQRTAISSPPAGLIVYDSDQNQQYVYNGTSWTLLLKSPSNIYSSTLNSPTSHGSLATDWTSSGSTQFDAAGGTFWRILTTSDGGYLDYTFPSNLAIGTYSINYTVEYQNNRGIMLVKIRYNGASSPDTTLRTLDLYSNYTTAGVMVQYQDFFTVTSSSTNVLRFLCSGHNASASGYYTGLVTPFVITRWA